MASIRSKNDKTLDRIRIIVDTKIDDFNKENRIATIQRYLIILYLANIHPSFKDAGKRYDDNLYPYFSGPKLKEVARGIAKDWGTWIKFDRSRTHVNKYKMCQNDHGYVDIKEESGNRKLFALTKAGFRHCEEIVNSSYRTVLSKNLSKVRVIAINRYLKKTYFIALKEDSSYILGTADSDLKREGITENSLIEYIKKEMDLDSGELLFHCRIEHINNGSLHILEDDGSIPRIKDIIKTDIKDIKEENELYYVRGKIISHWSPDDEAGVREIEDIDTGILEIQDRTGKIPYIKMPYDSGWRREAIKIGTWVEAIGIYKPFTSDPRDPDYNLISTPSLYAPYKVEFFRLFIKLS